MNWQHSWFLIITRNSRQIPCHVAQFSGIIAAARVFSKPRISIAGTAKRRRGRK
jgi:hypothetical protein